MTNLTGTTWRFNDNFTPPSSLIVMASSPSTKELFTCAGESFYRINGIANIYFSTTFTSSTEQVNVYNNGWTANKYRVITFTDEPALFEPNEETVMTWFKANATQIDFDKLLNLSDAKLLYKDLKQKMDAKINDTSTSTDKTWSSDNINTIKANKQNPVFEGSITLGTRNGSVGLNSAALGTDNTSSGNNSIAEGLTTTSSGTASHAEGDRTIANGAGSHAEGSITMARGNSSHSEGVYTIAFGDTSHAEGQYTVAVTPFSHVSGRYNVPSSMSSAPQWKANTEYQISQPIKNNGHYYVCRDKHTSGEDFDSDLAHWNEAGVEQDYLEIIGNGIGSSSRSNARALDLDGNEYLAGDIYVNCDSNSTGGSKLISESYIAPMSDVQAIINAWG